MDKQAKLYNDLKVLNDLTQADLIKADRDLSKKLSDQKDLNLRFNEFDKATAAMLHRKTDIENELMTLKQQLGQLPDDMRPPINFDRPEKDAAKDRSLALFFVEKHEFD